MIISISDIPLRNMLSLFRDKIGKEVITSYSTVMTSDSTFYTDSNAREMIKRRLFYRPTWDLKLEEQVAGNYYPVTSKIQLKTQEPAMRFTVLTDRAQGGTSMADGQIELMVIELMVPRVFGFLTLC